MTCVLRKNLGNREERVEYVTATGSTSVDLSQFFQTRSRQQHRPHAAAAGELTPTRGGFGGEVAASCFGRVGHDSAC